MKKKILSLSGIILLFLLGLGIMLYPVFSSMINNSDLSNKAASYTSSVKSIPKSEYKKIIKSAKKYNNSLNTNAVITDPFDAEAYNAIGADYDKTMNYRADGMICTLEIPAIDVNIPVYHGTSDSTLESGAGHLPNTSMPIGGKSTHAVIAAHSGFPGKTFFDYLEDAKIGDVFYIRIFNKTLQYEVDQIKVVLPENTDYLRIINGKDYVTLLTCTPYGVNDHRLLVRGKRVSYVPNEYKNQDSYAYNSGVDYFFVNGYKIKYITAFAIVGGFVLLIALTVFFFIRSDKRKKAKSKAVHVMEENKSEEVSKKER